MCILKYFPRRWMFIYSSRVSHTAITVESNLVKMCRPAQRSIHSYWQLVSSEQCKKGFGKCIVNIPGSAIIRKLWGGRGGGGGKRRVGVKNQRKPIESRASPGTRLASGCLFLKLLKLLLHQQAREGGGERAPAGLGKINAVEPPLWV